MGSHAKKKTAGVETLISQMILQEMSPVMVMMTEAQTDTEAQIKSRKLKQQTDQSEK